MGPTQITFPVGARTVCFNVPILEDDITEDNEIFEITATPSVGGPPIVISVCIRDNDGKESLATYCVSQALTCIHVYISRGDIQIY